MEFILRTILVIIFHKLYQQHSERLFLQSSEAKSHRHLNIKAFAFLKYPFPGSMPSINRCNNLNNNKTDSTSTCEHLRPLHHLGLQRIPY